MIGDTWQSEQRTFRDPKTNRQITQLTSTGNNVHLYFTENAFDSTGQSIIFRSDRASSESRAPHEEPHYNIFRQNLETGIIEQLTDEAESVSSVTKTPDSHLIAYIAGNAVKVLDTRSNTITTVYEETQGYSLGSASINADRSYVGFARNEPVDVIRDGANYSGFKERFYAIKDGRLTLAKIDGSGHFDVLIDTHQVGHFQFSPTDTNIAMFCHEGPWNLVTQRMWGIDVVSRRIWPYFRQNEEDSIGHEFWTQDGQVFFDNRGPGHDGTITSDRTQAVAVHVQVNENSMQPFVGLLDVQGNLLRRIDMPFYCNHYHANPNNTVLVGDDVDEIVLIDISGQEAKLEVLLQHGTSWHTQSSHCHPTWSWDGSRILYASDAGGRVNLFLLDL
jgi:oligogalacturonide lyase